MAKETTSIYIEEKLIDQAENDDEWDRLSHLVSHLLHEYYSSNTESNTGAIPQDGVEYATQDDLENMREELVSEIRAVEDLIPDDENNDDVQTDSDEEDTNDNDEPAGWGFDDDT